LILIPFRAKNPPERFPYVTLTLIALNVLIFALTSEYFLFIRESAVEGFALTHSMLSAEPWRFVTHAFLHVHLLHLAGNMLFLWIFGASLEGRLGHLKYIALYLFSGLTAALLHELVVGMNHPNQPMIGASGAIMGLTGGYLYVFPFAAINVVFGYPTFIFWRLTVMDWHARWVALWFIGFDLLNGFISLGMDRYGGGGGVANFAHLGGAAGGFLAVMLLRVKRDTEEFSEAQKARVESGGHYPAMSLPELESLIEGQPDNAPAILAYCRKAMSQPNGYTLCHSMVTRHGKTLVEKAEPLAAAQLLLALPPSAGSVPSSWLLRLGSRLESDGDYLMATNVFRHLYRMDPNGRDTEIALLRLARLTEQTDPNKAAAAAVYAEMLRRFPNGTQADAARDALRRLPKPNAPFTDVPIPGEAADASGGAASPTPPQAPPGLATVPGHAPVSGAPAMPMISMD
jgi:Uncharacterized membrane protein (homolog of Drosophila rhomboid)